MTRDSQTQRGSAMIVAMVSLIGMLGLGSLTIMTLSGGLSSASNDRFKTVALYAAESGAAAGVVYLRTSYHAGTYWSELVTPSNEAPETPEEIPGNGHESDSEASLMSADTQAKYVVTVLNNPGDPSYAAGDDADGRVILRSTGYGPNGAIAIIEVEVVPNGGGLGGGGGAVARPCPGYGQRGMSGDNAGRNDCLSTVDHTIVTTYRPGS
jgi:hypothetical protein